MLRSLAFPRSLSLHTDATGPPPPNAFGPFRVLHQVGAGALGPVFRAYDPDRDRLVAIKLFRLDLPPERVHQLVADLERLIGLTHAGIAAPLSTGIDGNSAYLVQAFTAADSLDIVIRDNGPAPPAEALRLAMRVAAALDFAASVEVEHGSLHPRDVLMSADETRITGLGIGRALERVGVTPPVRRPYTAPERVGGAGWDRRADIFSLAALVHEMLWGRRVAGTGQQVAEGLTACAGADLDALGRTLARALADDPASRFGTALEFATALKHAFPGVEPSTGARRARNVGSPPPAVETPAAVDARPSPHEGVMPEPEIRPAATPRYEDVESAAGLALLPFEPAADREPAFRPPLMDAQLESPTSPPHGLLRGYDAEPASALDRSRSAVWPPVLALTLALALGFGLGYMVGRRDRGVSGVAPVPATPPAQAAAPGREFTETAVTEPPPPVKPAVPSPAADVGLKPDTHGSAPSDASGSVADTGRLLVRSTPVGARVFVDGRDLGRTPATLRDLGRGSHRVRLVHEGYATEERRVVIAATQPTPPVIVVMTRTRAAAATARGGTADAPAFGVLSVESRPAGARVFLDGALVGTTPLMLPRVGTGEHAVRLEHDGYRRWVSSVRILAGERNRVTASLEK